MGLPAEKISVLAENKLPVYVERKFDNKLIDSLFDEHKERNKAMLLNQGIFWSVVLAFIIWSWMGTEFKISYFFSGLTNITNFILLDLLPPDFSVLPSLVTPALESLYMAYIGTTISIVLSIILGFLAAKNTSFHPFLANFSRFIITFIRAVPGLVIGIFFVGALGLGPVPGTLAIGIGGVGILAKAYADILENIDHGQVEAVRATGASWIQMMGQAVWPQFYAGFVAWSFYKMDLNMRASAILGMIGAGGLGTVLMQYIKLFQYQKAVVAIMIVFLMIAIVEFITAKVRERII